MPDRQSTNDNNPFAPPPEGQPDQPWQPRQPQRPDGPRGRDDHAADGSGDGSGDPSSPVTGSADGRWSPRQPGRSSDGFGGGPERRSGGQGGGPAGPGPERPGLRWDPTDPAQRRARYAVLGGMWAFFFAIFDLPQLALLLGALSVYWAVSALRSKPKETGTPGAPEAAAGMSRESQPPSQPSGRPAAPSPARSMRTAAIGGLVSATVALLIVGFGFTMQLVYRDFYECRDDALTHAGELACNDLLPKPLRTGFGVRE
ncbi:hypothetical protein ACIQRS_06900 [Streptomyces termitum]|uniref:Integral membrane protein n=1 Tax=Streptomyces termitum TaxID=67368 RepID=A0A918SSW0_9ACTN|nr:hypothetical protein [Streptomyces termitum]GHA66671.1 hypothetical protein GCM10010305_05790 [Streptomyces termitum]